MGVGTDCVNSLLEHFRLEDPSGRGVVDRSAVASVLDRLGCQNIDFLLDRGGFAEANNVKYEEFLDWLQNGPSKPSTSAKKGRIQFRPLSAKSTLSHDHGPALDEIAASLVSIAATIESMDPVSASALVGHADSLKSMCMSPAASETECKPFARLISPDQTPRSASKSRSNTHGCREKASAHIEQTGKVGELVDDLEEVATTDIEHKSAISYWRFCHGVRLFKSPSVTQALRLICSAPVPGLGQTSYLDVFGSLTDSAWEHHIYLFGGLVRDILRRKVGNDIDIAFSAPAVELDAMCQKNGSFKCSLDGDYILIGDEQGDEYLEGMVITHNGLQPSYHSDFSMNWLFYDFCNDVIVDKTGGAVPAIMRNSCDIPCPREEWDSWVRVNGSRVLFRYFKFLLRGYVYNDSEMAYIASRLLDFWQHSPEETVETGQIALGNAVPASDAAKTERLRQLVFKAFELAQTNVKARSGKGRSTISAGDSRSHSHAHVTRPETVGNYKDEATSSQFFSANQWWQRGWSQLLAT